MSRCRPQHDISHSALVDQSPVCHPSGCYSLSDVDGRAFPVRVLFALSAVDLPI